MCAAAALIVCGGAQTCSVFNVKAVVAAFNQEKALGSRGLLRDYEPSDGTFEALIHTHISDVKLSTAHRYSPRLYPPDIPEYTDHPLTTHLDTRQQHPNILQTCCVVLDAEH